MDLESQRLIFEEVKFCREGMRRTKSTEDEEVKIQAAFCRLCFNDNVLMRDSIMARRIQIIKWFHCLFIVWKIFSPVYRKRRGRN